MAEMPNYSQKSWRD